ncbi:MAG: hypothetical protein H6868_10095 [Rhodospirillales bacterium]|nr:hypothetical protein [Rhodospirillales bacterium]
MRPVLLTLTMILTLSLLPHTAMAGKYFEEFSTDISIAVKSKDAKFIGTAMGGAHVMVIDKLTGDILAEGITHGGTGNTAKIMAPSLARDAVLVDDDTAKFEFSLDILKPTPVTITATAPLAQPQSTVKASIDYVLLPGKDYTAGNGIMLELPGMAVDILNPSAGTAVRFSKDISVPLTANIVKLCGCHVADGSPWPIDRYDIEAYVYNGTILIGVFPLEKMDIASRFATNLKFQEAGTYQVIVTAFDKKTMEAGMDRTTITLTE